MAFLLFNLLVAALILFDLGLGRRQQTLTARQAIARTLFYVVLAVGFGLWLGQTRGTTTMAEYFAGYLVEYALSMDNIFVFIAIFSFFAVPEAMRPRVLLWGVLGALIMRGLMIWGGAALLERFHWLLYVFGVVLIFTGLKFLRHKEEEGGSLERNPVLRLVRRLLPVTEDYHGGRFFIRRNGRLWATPLFVVLVLIETTDLMFALDSIPAIFGITRDPFVVYTANVFAIIGLRSLFFVFSAILPLIRYLRYGLAVTLVFIGVKMLLIDVVHLAPATSLGILALILGTSVLASVLFPRREPAAAAGEPTDEA
ncbi:Integral membrane protein TerC [Thermaerobacter marianensis DSM 12885]|uniref:Integral membrane protein TerC n=1 Tax=Thermaerobacter marianensis (strain ATCC 700841 / DSM 12885 / JCM 10246 / 7p75a) TaxID=644966 RepID=E6SH99_THEM7|nr:TerC family protein [Thermaerobacter marianensis]ADU51763.1 Integral membrane protein TerC [Thermaerobacter marianensis DSM 12885]